jgi:hypothetical protein
VPDPQSKFLLLTRIGFAARGVMYLLVAYLTLRLGRGADSGAVLAYLNSGAGRALLAGMAAGFAAYAAWRIIDAALDIEHRGNGAKALIIRISHAGSGLVHGWLGFKTAKLALGGSAQGGSGEVAENGAATAMQWPGGDWLLLVAAGIVLFVAGVQLSHAVRRKFLRHLRGGARDKWWINFAGVGGYAARGIIFAMAAWLVYRASMDHAPEEAGGLGDAMTMMNSSLRVAVAAGLALFGSYSLIEAWYRIIPNPRVKRRVQAAVNGN